MKTEVVQVNELIEELRNNISIPKDTSYQYCTHCDYCEFVDLEWEDLDIEPIDFNTLAETLYYKLGYRKIDKDKQVVDTEYLNKLESKYDELRKETAKEIFNKLIKITEDEFKGSLPLGVLKAWALEYGVEV